MPSAELMVLEFPGTRADLGVVSALTDAVEQGQVHVLDLVFLARNTDGSVRVVDVDEELDEHGFGQLVVGRAAMLSEEDVDTIIDGLSPGTSAAILVYELLWSRKVIDAVLAAGGQVALHAQVPPDAVTAAQALAAAE